MVTRRSRSYKENRPSAALGRTLLPVAVIMACALFYFSIKLFFFEPDKLDMNVTAAGTPPANSQLTVMKKTSKFDPAITKTVEKSIEIDEADAGSITPPAATIKTVQKTAAVKTAAPDTSKNAKQTVTPASGVKKTTQAAAAQEEPRDKYASWEIQIGGFSDEAGAEQTQKKAQNSGYSAYTIKTEREGKPFYKVRVKGPQNKKEADEIFQKLAKAGFPVYLIRVERARTQAM